MDTREAKRRLIELEKELVRIMEQFTEETDVYVRDIDIDIDGIRTATEERTRYRVIVKAEI